MESLLGMTKKTSDSLNKDFSLESNKRPGPIILLITWKIYILYFGLIISNNLWGLMIYVVSWKF